MGQRITIVDSFTDTPFAGNPAGVCVLAEPTTDGWMQAVAAELNLSETAFGDPPRLPGGPAGAGGRPARLGTGAGRAVGPGARRVVDGQRLDVGRAGRGR